MNVPLCSPGHLNAEGPMNAPLFATEGNPIPDGISAEFMKTPDGRNIRYAMLPASGPGGKGTVIILHGRNECIEKYFETMSDLATRGFATLTFDWIGQGGSDRIYKDPHKGYVRDFNDYIDDLDQFMTDVALPDCRAPFYILAHSTGSLAAILSAPKMNNRIRRMVLLAPLLGLAGMPVSQTTLRRLSGLMRFVGLGGMYLAGGPRPRETKPFLGNKLTSDEKRYRRNSLIYEQHPQLALGGPTATWVNASCHAINTVSQAEFKSRIQIPSLIIAAGGDEIVGNSDIESFVRGLRTCALVTIDGARHELLQEQDYYRDQVLAAFDAFVPGSET